jgi:hypothetical protein
MLTCKVLFTMKYNLSKIWSSVIAILVYFSLQYTSASTWDDEKQCNWGCIASNVLVCDLLPSSGCSLLPRIRSVSRTLEGLQRNKRAPNKPTHQYKILRRARATAYISSHSRLIKLVSGAPYVWRVGHPSVTWIHFSQGRSDRQLTYWSRGLSDHQRHWILY